MKQKRIKIETPEDAAIYLSRVIKGYKVWFTYHKHIKKAIQILIKEQ